MDIEYKSKDLEKACTQFHYAKRKYGERQAELLHQRIDELHSADSVEMLIQYKIGRCHLLTQNRNGQYAMDLCHPYRLIFEKKGIDIQIVRIIEIIDYH